MEAFRIICDSDATSDTLTGHTTFNRGLVEILTSTIILSIENVYKVV